jgi:lipoxygenase
LLFHKPSIQGSRHASFFLKSTSKFNIEAQKHFRVAFKPSEIKAIASVTEESTDIKVKAVVTVKQTIGGLITSVGIERGLDDIKDLLGKTLLLELVSAELDPSKHLNHNLV